ncbi:MAG: hypothetical protein SGJ09_05390 [Phycisphaerae bacterium]|nr:hypothetical protein [Phycisphaerae bacterium]
MIRFLETFDRRIVFLLMGLAVAIPLLAQISFPEVAGQHARATFDAIDSLPSGSKLLFSFDYDPASEGELKPMAEALVYHAASKGHKLYFMSLWPAGAAKAKETINHILKAHFPSYVYGTDYMQLGFKAGNETVIKLIVTDLAKPFPNDELGTPLAKIPMMAGVDDIRAMDLAVVISAGDPGSKQWAQYYVAAYPSEKLVTGTTGVQSVSLYPYIPQQIVGMLGAIKGAAEYETLVNEKYPLQTSRGPEKFLVEGQRRMAPQLTAHLLMVALIILGNVVQFARKREGKR